MTRPHPTPDIHALILELETDQRIADELAEVRITLTETDGKFGDLDVQGVVYRKFPAVAGMWRAGSPT